MQKGVRLAFVICLVVTASVLVLQGFWMKQYYALARDRFQQEVNLGFEDAIKKEFALRNDTIEQKLYEFLMDTTEMRIISKVNPHSGEQMYEVSNAKNGADRYSFSRKELTVPLRSQSDSNRRLVARAAARLDREQDLDHHIIFYRTQNLGNYLQGQADRFAFDTARLRPVLAAVLAQRGIKEGFVFALKDDDNTLNRNSFPDSITRRHPVISKAFPTFRNQPGQNFVRAYFLAPSNYLFNQTFHVFAGSVLLLLAVGFAFAYLVKIIYRQKKLSAMKNDFISHITHEFKTPIATVYSAVQVMEDLDLPANEQKAKKYLRISKGELERLSDMVTKVLHISLYERTDFELKQEAVDLDALIRNVIATINETPGNNATINYHNQSASATLTGDAVHLYNSISNLFDNAVKYSAPQPVIDAALTTRDGYLVLAVTDNGCGIRAEHQEFVFDKFYRAPQNGAVRPKGFGLGLSYTKEVVQKHRGWCRVQSEYGQGSVFTIGLPLRHA